MTPRARNAALAIASGLGGALVWMPLGLEALHPLVLVPLLLALASARSGREAAAIGALHLGVRFALGAHFLFAILRYSPLAIIFYLLIVAYASGLGALQGLATERLARWLRAPVGLVFALVYTLLEWLRTVGDLSLPMDLHAHAHGARGLWLAFTRFTGPFALPLLHFGIAALLAHAWRQRGGPARPWALPLAAAGALWLAPLATGLAIDAGAPRGAGPADPGVRVGIVQPAATLPEKRDPELREELWGRLERLTERVAPEADLVVWPESARPGPVIWRELQPVDDPRMRALAARVGTPILYGAELARARGRRVVALYNAALLVRPEDGRVEWYGKRQLLPFAEGVPFASWIGWDPAERAPAPGEKRSILTMLGNFLPGPEPHVFEVAGLDLGVLICYEGAYPRLAADLRLEGADVLAVLTNDAWWGRSFFATWHAVMAGSRARENDVPVLRAANNGVSSLTSAEGQLVARSELGPATTLAVTVHPSTSGPTAYARHGDWLVAVILVALAALALRRLAPLGSRDSLVAGSE